MSEHDHDPVKTMTAEEYSGAFSTSLFIWLAVCVALFAGSVILFVLP